MMKLKICKPPPRTFQFGTMPNVYPAWALTISRRFSVLTISSGDAIAIAIGSS